MRKSSIKIFVIMKSHFMNREREIMKKIMLIIVMLLGVITLASCQKSYDEEAGLYELYEMSGDLSLSDFSYYTVELFSDGKIIIRSKSSNLDDEPYVAEATYEIKRQKIIIYTKIAFTKITERYDYIDGEIHMIDVEIPGYDLIFSAKFKRMTT